MVPQQKHRKPRRTDGRRMSLSRVRTNAHGENLCRWCDKVVQRPRLTFCSDDCIHEWKLRSQPAYRKAFIQKRDRGICQICGVDTFDLKRRLQALERDATNDLGRGWSQTGPFWPARFGAVVAEAAAHGISVGRVFVLLGRRCPFDIDHRVPLIEGGSHGPENLRTLCLGCHDVESRALKRRMANK